MADPIPLSRIIGISEIGHAGKTIEVAATPAECNAVARLLKIPGIAALHGRFALNGERQNRVLAKLHLTARVIQTCVVSLEAFETRLMETAPLIFVPVGHITSLDDDPESPDEIPFDGNEIDLGAVLTEQLALSLDPYPRKPEVVLPEAAQATQANPFSLFFKQAGITRADDPDD